MIPTLAAYTLSAYLNSSILVGATSTSARESFWQEQEYDQDEADVFLTDKAAEIKTAVSEGTPIYIGHPRASDALIAQISSFRDLQAGWDGEFAAPAGEAAIQDAIRFLRSTGDFTITVEPTLHADGSVLLEIGDEENGSLRFVGDGHVIFAIQGMPAGRVPFDGYIVPRELQSVLEC